MKTLESAVKQTINSVLNDVNSSVDEAKKLKLEALKANVGKIVHISIDEICLDDNVRKVVDEKSQPFQSLVHSIKRFGILENIVAELHVAGGDFKLVCLAGHRRILAARQIGTIKKVSCLIKTHETASTRVGAALSENLNREDLHAFDVADGYATLVANNWSIEELSKFYGRDQRTVKYYLKIAGWPEDIKDLVRSHPLIFSTRVILREFAYKNFSSFVELKNKIQEKINPNTTRKAHPPKKNLGAVKENLEKYFLENKELSKKSRLEILKAFKYLNLI